MTTEKRHAAQHSGDPHVIVVAVTEPVVSLVPPLAGGLDLIGVQGAVEVAVKRQHALDRRQEVLVQDRIVRVGERVEYLPDFIREDRRVRVELAAHVERK